MAPGRKTGGRQKGSVNRTTANVKAVLENAFQMLGGVDALAAWATENPGEFYKLWGKLVPRDLKVEADLEHRLTLEELVAGANE